MHTRAFIFLAVLLLVAIFLNYFVSAPLRYRDYSMQVGYGKNEIEQLITHSDLETASMILYNDLAVANTWSSECSLSADEMTADSHRICESLPRPPSRNYTALLQHFNLTTEILSNNAILFNLYLQNFKCGDILTIVFAGIEAGQGTEVTSIGRLHAQKEGTYKVATILPAGDYRMYAHVEWRTSPECPRCYACLQNVSWLSASTVPMSSLTVPPDDQQPNGTSLPPCTATAALFHGFWAHPHGASPTWRPIDCSLLAPPSPAALIRIFTGQHIMFIGDSTMMELFSWVTAAFGYNVQRQPIHCGGDLYNDNRFFNGSLIDDFPVRFSFIWVGAARICGNGGGLASVLRGEGRLRLENELSTFGAADVIVMNAGLHDAVSASFSSDYETQLNEFVDIAAQYGKTLVWRATTPEFSFREGCDYVAKSSAAVSYKQGTDRRWFDRLRGNGAISWYNHIAASVSRERGMELLDFHGVLKAVDAATRIRGGPSCGDGHHTGGCAVADVFKVLFLHFLIINEATKGNSTASGAECNKLLAPCSSADSSC